MIAVAGTCRASLSLARQMGYGIRSRGLYPATCASCVGFIGFTAVRIESCAAFGCQHSVAAMTLHFLGVCSGILEKGTQLLLFSPSLAVLSGTAFPHGLPNGVTRIFPLSVADQQQADTVNKTLSPYQPVSTRTLKCDRTRPKDGRRAATSLSNNRSGARWGFEKNRRSS